jgi:uncharacterized membrane protein
MNGERMPVLESLLAGLLGYGTWLASAVVGVGLTMGLCGAELGLRIITIGVAMFIALRIARVVLMMFVFVRQRDLRFAAIAAVVLAILLIGFAIGMWSAKPIEG